MFIVNLEQRSTSNLLKATGLVMSVAQRFHLFEPRSISVWYRSNIESEGGVLLIEEDVSAKAWRLANPRSAYGYLLYLVHSSFVNPRAVIVEISGTTMGLPSYIRAHGLDTEPVYGDVHFDLHATAEARMLSEIYVANETARRLLADMVVVVGRLLGRVAKYVVIGDSPDAQLHIDHWLAFYSRNVKELERFIARTVKNKHPTVQVGRMHDVLYELQDVAEKSGCTLKITPIEVIYVTKDTDVSKKFLEELVEYIKSKQHVSGEGGEKVRA